MILVLANTMYFFPHGIDNAHLILHCCLEKERCPGGMWRVRKGRQTAAFVIEALVTK